MLHTDIPTRGEIHALAATVAPYCVSIYTPTEADTATPDKNRIGFANQARDAQERVDDRDSRLALQQEFDDLIDDEDFWRYQSRTLVVLATPHRMRTYRVPNRLGESTTVGDRFFLKPLLRTVTFPQDAFVLALSEGTVRLVQVTPDSPARTVAVPGFPDSAADYVGKSSLGDRAPVLRMQGGEAKKLRVRQYARTIDQELRHVLSGREVPLILAATEPADSLYRSVNSYDGLLNESIPGNPEHLSDAELADRAREVLDRHYAAELADLRALFDERRSQHRTATDLADIARAATFGMVDTVFVDIDAYVPGTVDTDGTVDLASASDSSDSGVVDEIARRVLLTGGRVLAVRGEDVPDGAKAAAILRFAAS